MATTTRRRRTDPSDPVDLPPAVARTMAIRASALDQPDPFGSGPDATRAAVRRLGYVQIDTINVIERCHHHILWSRMPDYRPAHLDVAQSVDKSVFEYWTHALAYLPTEDFTFVVADMRARKADPGPWFANVDRKDVRRLLRRIHDEGPLSIRDIDDVPVEKDHPWASRKPSKRALEMAFFAGDLTISRRQGMVKTYELTDRHFGWDRRPSPANAKRTAEWMLDRALRSQGVVSLDSICHLDAPRKAGVRAVIDQRVRRRKLVPLAIEGAGTLVHWAEPAAIEAGREAPPPGLVHVLSPFDPLVIQRRRLALLFGYEHRFEAYVPEPKRVFGYFALPVLAGDRFVAAIDSKADRAAGRLLIRRWTWVGEGNDREHRAAVEEALGRFERFQFAGEAADPGELTRPPSEDGA
jgi:uncharacterized protein YcaQ